MRTEQDEISFVPCYPHDVFEIDLPVGVDNQHIQTIAVDNDIENSTRQRVRIQGIPDFESRIRAKFGAAPSRAVYCSLRDVHTQVPVSQPCQKDSDRASPRIQCPVSGHPSANAGFFRAFPSGAEGPSAIRLRQGTSGLLHTPPDSCGRMPCSRIRRQTSSEYPITSNRSIRILSSLDVHPVFLPLSFRRGGRGERSAPLPGLPLHSADVDRFGFLLQAEC